MDTQEDRPPSRKEAFTVSRTTSTTAIFANGSNSDGGRKIVEFFISFDGNMDKWSKYVEDKPVLDFIDVLLRGISQVIFINNPLSGLIILIGLFIASWWTAIFGLVGVLSQTVTAKYLQLPKSDIRAGLHGFNGTLVGLCIATFSLHPFPEGEWVKLEVILEVLLFAIFMSILSCIITICCNALCSTINCPSLTLGFNIAAFIFLAGTYQWKHTSPNADILKPGLPVARIDGVSIDTTLRDGDQSVDIGLGILEAFFRGFGQVYFADNVVSGVLMFVATVVYSRILAGFSLIGLAMAIGLGFALGVDGNSLYHGLWGYNAVLGSMAIPTFFVPTKHSLLLAFAAATSSFLMNGAIRTAFSPLGIPTLTFPFCLGTLPFLVLKFYTPRVIPVGMNTERKSTPERNIRSKKNKKDNVVELSSDSEVELP